jgi:hypothetical protein
MKKRTGFFVIALGMALAMNAAARDTLAILPFTGGQGQDGETIAELFSFNSRLNAMFSPIPRTTLAKAVENRPDAIADIGRQLGVKHVMTGNITSLGGNHLLVVSIISIDSLRQTAGDFQTFATSEEMREKLPVMVENLLATAGKNVTSLPKLSVVPVRVQEGADKGAADTLAQILAIHLIRSGKYAVYPQTSSLEQVQSEYNAQGNTRAGSTTLEQVLSVVARRLGSITMFNAAVIDLVAGTQVKGASVDYTSIDDGIKAMEALAVAIIGERRALAPAAPVVRGQSAGRGSAGSGSVPAPAGSAPRGQSAGRGSAAGEGVPGASAPVAGGQSSGRGSAAGEGVPAPAAPAAGGQSAGRGSAAGEGPGTGAEKLWDRVVPYLPNLKTGGLNVVGGLGSFLQKDWAGGATVLGGYAAAALLIVWEFQISPENMFSNWPGNVGLVVGGASIAYGFIRPFIYNRNKAAAEALDGVNVSVVSGRGGAPGFSLSYGINF